MCIVFIMTIFWQSAVYKRASDNCKRIPSLLFNLGIHSSAKENVNPSNWLYLINPFFSFTFRIHNWTLFQYWETTEMPQIGFDCGVTSNRFRLLRFDAHNFRDEWESQRDIWMNPMYVRNCIRHLATATNTKQITVCYFFFAPSVEQRLPRDAKIRSHTFTLTYKHAGFLNGVSHRMIFEISNLVQVHQSSCLLRCVALSKHQSKCRISSQWPTLYSTWMVFC